LLRLLELAEHTLTRRSPTKETKESLLKAFQPHFQQHSDLKFEISNLLGLSEPNRNEPRSIQANFFQNEANQVIQKSQISCGSDDEYFQAIIKAFNSAVTKKGYNQAAKIDIEQKFEINELPFYEDKNLDHLWIKSVELAKNRDQCGYLDGWSTYSDLKCDIRKLIKETTVPNIIKTVENFSEKGQCSLETCSNELLKVVDECFVAFMTDFRNMIVNPSNFLTLLSKYVLCLFYLRYVNVMEKAQILHKVNCS